MAKAAKKKKNAKKRESKQGVMNRGRLLKLSALLVITLLTYLSYCFFTLPNLEEAVSRNRLPSTTIVAENGNEVQSFGTIYSEIIRSEELPQYTVDAIVSTEDRRFYSHFGFDIISFTRAMVANVFAGRYAQGGSTITQQVAKNLFLTSQKSIKRKVQELLLAFWLEHKFNKEQILTLYLNRVYLGTGTYGIEAASQKYFQKSSRDLNLLESAIIAGMLKAPSRYNPQASKERAIARASVVLQTMVSNRYLGDEERTEALKLPIGARKSYKVENARYFADWVYHEINDTLGERDNDVYAMTTLDQDIQEAASKILRESLAANKDKNVRQGAIVVLDKAGAVKAMVGGANYNLSQFNRATQALRQPGSAFKPFVYLTALQHGWSPNDLIMDGPVSIGKWRPENIDRKYHGEVSLKYALSKSLNLATVNLSQQFPRRDIIKNAQKMGISTSIDNTPALVLGAFEVRVIDMAAAYATIANGGYAVWPHAVKEIYTKDGYQLYQRSGDNENRILDKDDVRLMTKMLENVVEAGTGKRAKLPGFSAGKTGTSQDNRDAWFVGFGDRYITAVWLGNDDDSPMKGVSGANLPAHIWKKVMLVAESSQ